MHEDLEIQREERAIYAIIIAASAPVVIGLLIEGGAFDGGAALSLVFIALGIAGLVAGVIAAIRSRRTTRLPRATLRRR